jgi:hypothetical protein
MDRHLTAEEIGQYRARQMAPGEILRVREHADSCEDCRTRLARSATGAAVVRSWIDPEPDEQELVLLAAGRLPAARAAEIEAHLTGCATCRETVEDLRTFAARPKPIQMPVRTRPVPLWWGAVAAAVLIGVYLISPSTRPLVTLGQVTLSRSGEVRGISGLDDQERTLIAEALRTGRLQLNPSAAPPETALLRGAEDKPGFHLLEPLGRRMLTDRPEFRWGPVGGAATYLITIFTEDEKIVAQATVPDTRWQPDPALPRGARLYWQVTARRRAERITAPAPPAPRAWFEIVSDEVAQRVARARSSELRLAVACAHEGLRVEALEAINAVVQANPDSPLARQLRDSLLVK